MEANNKENNCTLIQTINKSRLVLMGIAILWIVLFHSKYSFSSEIFKFIRNTGYGGVDIFLLLSGMGMYYSFKKSEGNILNFYKRRLLRIMPAYIPFLLVWFIIKIDNSNIELFNAIRQFIGNITMTGWWIRLPNQFNWYLQTIIWLYILSPIFYEIINKFKNKFQGILLVILSIIFSIPFINSSVLMGISRIPIFLIGMLLVHYSIYNDKNYNSNKRTIIISITSIILMILGFLILKEWLSIYNDKTLRANGTYWWPFIIITPGLSIIISYIVNKLIKIKVFSYLTKIIEIIGTSSFEIYLIHIALFDFLGKYIKQPHINIKWICIMALSIIIGIIYHFLINYIVKKISTIKVKKDSLLNN